MAGTYTRVVVLSEHVPDLGSLELLLAVSRTGGLGAAGRELGVSQQAVSSRMRTVERLVGVPLLDRGPRGTSLTDAGALLADWAGRVLDAAAELDSGIAALRGGRDERLRIAASLTVAEYLLPGWLMRLRARTGPGLGVSLVVHNTEQVARAVLRRDAAVGFVEGPELPVGLSSAVVGTDELVVVVAPGHPWARRRRRLTAADLAGAALVVRERGSGTRSVLEQALREAVPGAGLAEPALELAATTAIRHAVLAGAGPAVLSELAVRDDLDNGRLVRVRTPDGLELRRELRAVWCVGPPPAGPVRDLLALTGVHTTAGEPDRPPAT